METLYFDVDGVLLHFSHPFSTFWNDGLTLGKWNGPILQSNPSNWSFGFRHGIDDMTTFNRVLDLFLQDHDHLPLLHSDIPDILHSLHSKYRIELVSAYPHIDRRIENLLLHNIPFDTLVCDVRDKLAYVKEQEAQGFVCVAIFEDGPHHIDAYLSSYFDRIWIPRQWNYLKEYMNKEGVRVYDSPHEWKDLL